MPAFEIHVKCTCGCGDAFNAGFAVGLVKGFDIETTVRLAQATAALNATGLGSQAGVESFEHYSTIRENRKGPRVLTLPRIRCAMLIKDSMGGA